MDSAVLVGRNEPEPGQAEDRDHTRPALEFVHGLLQGAAQGAPPLAELLNELAGAFGAVAAGLAAPAEGAPLVRHREGQGTGPSRWPWEERPELLDETLRSPAAVSGLTAAGLSWLLASAWA